MYTHTSLATPLFLFLIKKRIDRVKKTCFVRGERKAKVLLGNRSVYFGNGPLFWFGVLE